MIILFNIASRERPEQFEELLYNIRDHAATEEYIIRAKLDNDDPFREHYSIILDRWPHVIPKWGQSYNKVHAINRDIPETGWSIMVNISDDQRFIVKGFDDIIRKAATNKFAFLHFPDQYKRAACSTMSIMTYDYFMLTERKVYHEDYLSLWPDVEATDVAKMHGFYHYIPTIIARHDHYSTTGRKKDALYKRNNTYKRDQSIYEMRKEKDFDLPELGNRMPNVLIKYPTRGRWRLFSEALDNIHSTIQTHKYQIQVTADIDDPEMNSNEVKELCKRYPRVSLVLDNHQSKIHACNSHMPDGAFDMIVLMSDDMRFIQFGWDTGMWKEIRGVWPEGTDYFAHFNDSYVGRKLPTLNVCGRQFYDRFGYLYHPSYKSVSCDAENMYVAQMLGLYDYFDTVYFTHDHPANLKQPSDYIYRRNHYWGPGDTENYFKRMRENFGLPAEYHLPRELKQYI